MREALLAAIPVWAHVAMLALAFALIAVHEWNAYRREVSRDATERELRRRLGACRTALEATEIQRDAHRKTADGLRISMAALQQELSGYRKLMPPDLRLTRVLAPEPGEE